jgi:hypothetical protein
VSYFKDATILSEKRIRNDFFFIDSTVIPFGFINSSVCKISDNVYNIRLVNYYINKSNRYFHFIENGLVVDNIGIKTVNLFNGKVFMKEIYNVPIFENALALGIEDIRLHKTLNGDILFLGTSPCFSSQSYNRVCFGLYDTKKHEINVNKVFESPFNSTCEKNWVFFNDFEIIYGWNPLRIYLLDSFKLIKSIKTPEVFSEFRGSTSVVKMNDLNYVVTHSVVSSTYLHHLIALDNYGNPIFYSKPFSFEGEAIEYCLSFSFLNNYIIQFHYSLWDGCSKSMDVRIDFFMDNKIDLFEKI